MKTLYKRIAHGIMTLVMLVSLTATVFAAEGYGFTTDDEPAEIYAIILRDHGKEKADEYKRAVLIYTGTTDSIIFNVDDYELGPKDQYKASDLQNAINHVANLIDPATVGSTQSDNNTGRMCPFTADDKPITIYNALASTYGLDVARDYKYNLSAQDYAEKHNGSMEGFDRNKTKVESKDYYSAETRQTAIEWVVYYINQHPDQPLPKNHTAPEAQKFADVKPGDWYYEAVNALTDGGLFTGYADGKFHPDEPITVAQFATVFCRLYGLEMTLDYNGIEYTSCVMPTMVNGVLQNPRAYGERKEFTTTDAKNNPHWGYDAVYNLVWETDQYDIVDPRLMDTPITRGQLMKEMNIAITSTRRSYDYPKTEIDMSTIPDADTVWGGPASIMAPVYKTSNGDIINVEYGNEQRLGPPVMYEHPENYEIYSANRSWSRSSIELAYEYGITTGVDGNHTANPNGLVTRAQFCQMLYNAGFTHADMNLCRNNGGLSGGSN